MRGCFLPHSERQDGYYDIIKPAGFETNKNFSDNDCMAAEFYKNVYLRNNFRHRILGNKKVSEKN